MSEDKGSNSAVRIEHLKAKVRELAFLHETSQLLTATLDLDSLLRSLMTQVRDFFQVEAVSVALVDEGSGQLTFRVAVGKASKAVTGLKLPLGKGIAGWVAQHGESILVQDVYDDPRFYSGVDEKTVFHTRTVLAAPIKAEQGTIGAIEALNPAADLVDERHLDVLEQVAAQAALAIHNAELYQRARRAEKRYEQLFHGSPVPVFVMDFDTRIIDLNEQAADLIGRQPDELIGTYWCDWLGDEQAACEAFFDDTPESGKTTTQMQVPTRGGTRTLRVHMTVINYSGERAIQWIGHDITELTVDIPQDLPRLEVDQDMITRVLTNLIDNAAKFTQTGGEIALTVQQRGDSLAFTVSDNGPGISPDAQNRVFERFTRLESTRKTKGTGLGLPFCKLAVEAHGGEIWVDSTPGEGSAFTFTLPLEAA